MEIETIHVNLKASAPTILCGNGELSFIRTEVFWKKHYVAI